MKEEIEIQYTRFKWELFFFYPLITIANLFLIIFALLFSIIPILNYYTFEYLYGHLKVTDVKEENIQFYKNITTKVYITKKKPTTKKK